MKHYGDITKLSGYDLPIVDVITGGSPCQDLSVAGKRAGLDGERSGLFMEQIRIVKEMREHDRANGRTGYLVRPRYMVWENVPGAFSSNKGKDFQAVLTEIVRIAEPESPDVPMPEGGVWSKSGCLYDDMGRWSVAWRVHDAQFWGVAQRRKRIALVADFGGLSAPEICFERKGMCRDSEESREERKGATGTTAESIRETGGVISFQERAGKPGGDKGILIQPEHVGALSTVNNQSVYCLQGGGETSKNAHGSGLNKDVSFTLNAVDRHGIAVFNSEETPKTVYDGNRRHDYKPFGDTCETVQAKYGTGGNNTPLVVQPITIEMTSTKNTIITDGISPTLTARMGTGGNQVNAVCMDVEFFQAKKEVSGALLARQYKDPPIINKRENVVRRLTPMECERLQGFPDGWTDIGDWADSKGKKHKSSDALRYKALGNSIAIPFWFYLLRRISAQYERPATLASLFDGIGGFPYCWERCNGKGTAIWASEIEEFPIAVTKEHFPEVTE